MSKIILAALIAIFSFGCTGRTMNRVITSWEGSTIDEVINAWGYPTAEKTIAGHLLYVWEQYNGADVSLGFWPGAAKWSGQSVEHKYCNRILEVNNQRKVVGGQWDGTDCPKFFSSWERKAANPKNDK